VDKITNSCRKFRLDVTGQLLLSIDWCLAELFEKKWKRTFLLLDADSCTIHQCKRWKYKRKK